MGATVIVPTHRGADRIGGLLDSLARQSAAHQVLVVDNGSADGTSHLLNGYPDVEVIRLERNIGFGPAVNLAAQRADGEALALVNDDCICDPGFVEQITRPLGGDVVMAAGVMRDHADEDLIDTAGMELSPTLLVFDYLHGQALDALHGARTPIGPSGAAAAFDRAAFLEAGGFDEALFAYWEDVDLVLRLRLAGGSCALAPDAQGTHLHSATLGPGSASKNRLMGFGRGYVLRKWSVMRSARAFRFVAEDASICAGQTLVDRNLAGLGGRVSGWRAARPAYGYPEGLLREFTSPEIGDDLRRRLRRRRRTRRLRSEAESPREGLERELAPAASAFEGSNGRCAADLTVPLPSPVPVGRGTVIFLGGRLDARRSTADTELLVDGAVGADPVSIAQPDRGEVAFWWTTLALAPVSAPKQLLVELRGRDQEWTAEVARVAVDQAGFPPASAQGTGVAEAVAAAGDGPLVAICMASYEPMSALFRSQIESIKAQTHTGWICMISDDSSSPATRRAMRLAIGDDPRFVLLEHDQRLGFYGNFERALSNVPAEADLVALADQDDKWYADKLEALMEGIGERDLVYGDMRIVGDDGSLISETYWSRRRNNYTDLASLLVGNTVTGAAAMFRADLLPRALPFPPRQGNAYHDHWIALAAMTRRGLAYVDRPVQDYVQHREAAQGHAEANAGAAYLQLRMIAVLAWQALRTLLGRPGAKGWASRYFGVHVRTVIWAKVLLMRSPDSLAPRQKRVLERVSRVERSPIALAWLAGRSLRPLWGANEAFGRELLLLSSVMWVRALGLRSRCSFSRRASNPG